MQIEKSITTILNTIFVCDFTMATTTTTTR